MGQSSIVGNDQETFGVHVQATHRKDTDGRRDVFEDGRSTLRVRRRRDDAGWLVEQEIHLALGEWRHLSINTDNGYVRIDTITKLGGTTIDRDASLGDKNLAGPTRTVSGAGQQFLKAFALLVCHLDAFSRVDSASEFIRQGNCGVDGLHELFNRGQVVE